LLALVFFLFLCLLQENPERWRPYTLLERRFPLQSYWEDVEHAIPGLELIPPIPWGTLPSRIPAGRVPGLPGAAQMLRAVHGHREVPFAVHFAGCQLCSEKLLDARRAVRCAQAFERVVGYAVAVEAEGLDDGDG